MSEQEQQTQDAAQAAGLAAMMAAWDFKETTDSAKGEEGSQG